MATRHNYVLISPCRDEAGYMRQTLDTVICQSVLPAKWIIVDDGSRDQTASIVCKYADEYSWIRVVNRGDRGFRSKAGGVDAFLEAYSLIRTNDWEYLVNLDGDMTFAADYFEQCFDQFRKMPKLGIGGGTVYAEVSGRWQPEQAPAFHVRGATKIYRRQCWDAVGGLWKGLGWDTVDEVKANQLGWITQSFPNIKLFHHRVSGKMWGAWGFSLIEGEADYIVGYLPLFFGLKCVRHVFHSPFLVRSIGMMYGYLQCIFRRTPRVADHEFVAYLRGQQLRRLLGMSSIWK